MIFSILEPPRAACDPRCPPSNLRRVAVGAVCCVLSLMLPVRAARAQAPSAPGEAPPGAAPADPPPPSAPPAPPAPADPVTLPEPLTRVEARYPAHAWEQRLQGTTVLFITVERDGTVAEPEVAESAGAALDAAAIAAVQQWRFRPATRGGEPVRARIRVPFEFVLPPEVAAAPAPSAPVMAATRAVEPSSATPGEPERLGAAAPTEVTVQGERQLRSDDRSSADFTVGHAVLAAAPRQEGAEVLRTAPGLYIARAEGGAVAHRYMLRGFDADHGQDLEFRVAGLPINLPSHLHGQGYADLGFLIAETVNELHATEGVYDPRQGDFAVAGSIDLELGVERRGWLVESGYGSFDTYRQLLLWAPHGEETATFGAAQYTRTDGFGRNRRGQAASGIAQTVFGSGAWRQRLVGVLYGARSDLAGVVRADDVATSRVGFYDVYPYPTAQSQNALSTRLLTGFFAEYRGTTGDNAEVGVWLGLDNFRLQENFTGFIQRSRTLENVAGRGDLIEQRNRTRSVGLSARYRSAVHRPTAWARGAVELGMSGRVDQIDQAQNLLDAAVRGQTWDRRVDASVLAADLGFWGDLDWSFSRYLRLRLGVRGDALLYDIDDRLGNFAPIVRPDHTYIVGFRRSAFGVAWGPRTSAELEPFEWLSIRAAYGEGYRSPQARILEDGEEAPFSKVRSADVGVRLDWQDRYELTLAGYATQLSDDVAFDAEEGRLERIGATRRVGAVAHAHVHPLDWVHAASSVTVVDAELLEPPPATAEEPQPPFEPGQNLPFVPPVVVRVDLGVHPTLARDVAGRALVGRAGVGFSFLSPRPLPFGEFADPVSLLDGSVGLGWGPFELSLESYNLLDTRYAASEFHFASAWDPEAPRSRTPARHIAAGAPFSFLVSLGVSL